MSALGGDTVYVAEGRAVLWRGPVKELLLSARSSLSSVQSDQRESELGVMSLTRQVRGGSLAWQVRGL